MRLRKLLLLFVLPRPVLCFTLVLGFILLCRGVAESEAGSKNIYAGSVLFLAGKPSHGWGEHEHHLGCEVLAQAINDSGLDIKASVHYDTWPGKDKLPRDLRAIVIYCDGDGKHIARGHEKEMLRLANKGIGIACLHYAVAASDKGLADALLDCIGGHYEKNWSVNPFWTPKKPVLADHPITRGVKNISVHDEWYYHMRFRKNMEGVTPVLSALPSQKTLGKKDGPHTGNPALRKELADGVLQHIAWTAENRKGFRGFGFTGGHSHSNWAHDDFRKLVLNAILWTAGIEVPENGVESRKPIIVTNKTITQAIARGDTEDVRRHIMKGADVNGQNSAGWTPLHYAAVRGKTDIAKLLFELGAKVDVKTNSDKTALHFAADRNFVELASFLIENGAHITAGDNEGWSPLHYAAVKSHTEMARLLIEKGAKVNLQSKRGGTPLHEAAASAGPEMIRLLLDKGADPSIKAQNGKTPLDYAIELENREAEKLLRAQGGSKK